MSNPRRDPSEVLARAHRDWSGRPEDAQRVRRAVQQALASGLAAGSTRLARPAPKWAEKLLLAGAITAVSTTAGYWAGRRAGLREGRAPLLAVKSADVAPDRPRRAEPPETDPPASPVGPVTAAAVRAARGGASRHEVANAALFDDRAEARPLPNPGASSLTAEVRALRNSERALRDGNPGLALAFLADLDRQVPHGQLTEEREAVAIVARCAHGDLPFGVDLASDFVDRYPSSVYRARVFQACAPTDRARPGDSPSGRPTK